MTTPPARQALHNLHAHVWRYGISRGIPAFVGVVALTVFTSLLSPLEYGYAAVFLATCGITVAVLFSYLQQATLRFWSRFDAEGRSGSFLGTIAAMFFVTAAILTSGVLLDRYLTKVVEPSSGLHALFIFSCLALAAKLLVMDLVRAKLEPSTFVKVSLGASLLLLSIGTLLIVSGFGYRSIVYGQIVADMVPAGLVWLRLHRRTDGKAFRCEVAMLVLRYGIPLTGVSSLNQALYNGSRLVVSLVAGPAVAGIYSAAYDLAQRLVTVAMQVVNLASWPLIVREFDRGPSVAVQDMVRRNLSLLLALGLPAVVIASIGREPLSKVVLGEQFAMQAVEVLPYAAIAAFLGRLKANHLDAGFMLYERTGSQLVPVAVMALVGLLLTAVLSTSFRAAGAAQALVVAYFVGAVLSWWFTRKRIRLLYYSRDSLAACLASAAMGVPLYLLSGSNQVLALGFAVVTALGLYAVLLVSFNFAGARRVCKEGFRRMGRVLTCFRHP